MASVREKWEEKKAGFDKVINDLVKEKEGVKVELKGAKDIIEDLKKKVSLLESRLERITHKNLNKSFASASL